ncbi:hypothetical protein D9M69_408540 [compost metagenome]
MQSAIPTQLPVHTAAAKIERELTERFGPLLTTDHLAEVFHRPLESLRWSLWQQSEFAKTINSTRVKIGRRNYYRAADLAFILAGGATQ